MTETQPDRAVGGIPQSLAGHPPLATTAEVADYLGVPIATLHAWRSRKKGPAAMRVGKFLRWRWETVDAWVEAQALRDVDRTGENRVRPQP